jgi:hypothetical protein
MNRVLIVANLDKDAMVSVEIPMRELAERLERMSYGAHRLLSHLIDVRREQLKARIERYRKRGDADVAAHAEAEGDALADGLEALLNKDLV